MKPFLPAIIWAAVIFGMSIGPSIQLPETAISPDKIGHLIAYGILTLLIIKALEKKEKLSSKTGNLTVLTVSIYGIALEIVQWAFFPNRYFEVWDMVANFLGSLLCYLAFKIFFTKT
jgi:VanZ family protein